MANHKSALKRIRSNDAKRLRNRYQLKSCRTIIKKFKNSTDEQEKEGLFRKISSALDKLSKKNIIHRNKAANSKSRLAKSVGV